MAIAAPLSTAISAGSREAPAFPTPQIEQTPFVTHAKRPDVIKGIESEENVVNALRELPFIESITRHQWYSPEDANGTDITLQLNDEFLLQEGFLRKDIRIQVKSRDGNMDKFYHNQDKKRVAENSPLSLDEYIAVQGFMVLNGQHEKEVIVEKFQTKLAFIQEVTRKIRMPSLKPIVVFSTQ